MSQRWQNEGFFREGRRGDLTLAFYLVSPGHKTSDGAGKPSRTRCRSLPRAVRASGGWFPSGRECCGSADIDGMTRVGVPDIPDTAMHSAGMLSLDSLRLCPL